MSTARLEAFSDGVFAIVITILVLEFERPHGVDLEALRALAPSFLTYALSFVLIAIYWNNHHHLLRAARGVSAGLMWSNAHLLFWLALVPFVTGWWAEHYDQSLPTASYGFVLLMCAIAYVVLQRAVVATRPADQPLVLTEHADVKGALSLVAYLGSIGAAFVTPWISAALFVFVALLWLVPDRRLRETQPQR